MSPPALRPRRRLVLLVLLLAVVAAWGVRESRRQAVPAGPAWVAKITEATRAQRPNLLLVVYDARRRDDFSFGPFGNARGDTPFLARFKDEAVYFEDAVSPGCWTVPVHAAIFSGLSVCELGNDYYNPGWSSLPKGFLSLPEILRAGGYETIAYPDHPYFYNSHADITLIRGFERFNVVSDFESYTSSTNVNTPEGKVVQEPRLPGAHRPPSMEEVAAIVSRMGEKGSEVEGEADLDPVGGVLLARLPPLFRESSYFKDRYERELDLLFAETTPRRPYFLFLNLHMATVARPDPGLFARWAARTLALNARKQGRPLPPPRPGEDFDEWLASAALRLRLSHAPLPSPALYLKHVFDNRFYDATFEAAIAYLERRGLMRNTVTVVTSDHGMSLRENGESLYLHSGARPYEYLIRVPLVVRFPEGSPQAALHERRPEAVSLLDLFPTLVNLGLGPGVFERALPVRGQDLVSRLRNRSFEPYLVAESAFGPSTYRVAPGTLGYSKAVLAGRLKLIHVPRVFRTPAGAPGWPITVRLGEGWPLPPPAPPLEVEAEPVDQLFDLVADPHETRDLARERPAEVARIKALVRSWSCQSLPWEANAPIWQGESLATLRALGYIN